jgi:pyruvate/2-oxoglutarate/acetoin dehydrogenase E1 component
MLETQFTPEEKENIIEKVLETHRALVGNEAMGQKGLVQRIISIEEKVETHERLKERIVISFGLLISVSAVLGYIADKIISYFIGKHQ